MTVPATKILYAAPFRRLEALLAAALDRFAAGDPLRERRVLVTSNRLRDHLQALLAKERAYAGVSFLTLRDLAAELGEPFFRKEGFRRLPALGGAALGEKGL
ncbi:MAG: hypothetical protein O2807_12420, partial [bacterium]|nr:hypothetical protein [bacterium]